ncbi:MAG TPA: TetR/AcrR family transcriptional regulator [Elusimicrobiota bacterium]|nr:TetR/AcrR family transcriptional regulator [Elusimicrobiota bacterium]
MSRPSGDADRRLVRAGRELLPRTGLSGLNVRRLADRAGVNLGMFHYHFKTKRVFVRQVLQEIYEEFFRGFSLETSAEGPAIERLRRALQILGRFSRDNRALVLCLLADGVRGEAEALRFAKHNLHRHVSILVKLIVRAQVAGDLPKVPPPALLGFLMGGVAVPNLVAGLLERQTGGGLKELPLRLITSGLLSDESVDRRVEWALAAFAKRRRP